MVDSLSINKAYCVGDSGKILKSNNIGNQFPTFYFQNSPTIRCLKALYFINYQIGLAVGDTGTVIKTTDGGIHWSLLTPITQNSLYSLHFPSNNTGYSVGTNGIVLKTTDNGQNWVSKTQPVNDTLRSVWFTTDNTGFVVSRNGGIYKTTDGGNTWQSKPSGTTQNLKCIQFYTVNTGYAAGDNNVILKTINAGETWINQNFIVTPAIHYNNLSVTNYGAVSIVGNRAGAAGNHPDGGSIRIMTKYNDVTLYPNPAHNQITITTTNLPEKETLINIYNSQGQLLLSESMHNQNNPTIDISQLPAGIYMAKLQTEEGLAQKKFVVIR